MLYEKESLNPNLKSRECLCVMNPKWDLALQMRGLKAGGSPSRFTFKYSRSHMQASSLTAKCSVGVIQHYEA